MPESEGKEQLRTGRGGTARVPWKKKGSCYPQEGGRTREELRHRGSKEGAHHEGPDKEGTTEEGGSNKGRGGERTAAEAHKPQQQLYEGKGGPTMSAGEEDSVRSSKSTVREQAPVLGVEGPSRGTKP